MRRSVLIFSVELDDLMALYAQDVVQGMLLSELGIVIYVRIVGELLMIGLGHCSTIQGSVLEHGY